MCVGVGGVYIYNYISECMWAVVCVSVSGVYCLCVSVCECEWGVLCVCGVCECVCM